MNKIFIVILAIILAWPAVSSAQRSDSIAAVVNDDVITYIDLYDRMNLVITSSRMPNTKDFKERLLPQVLTGLITETIQIQEAERLGLETTLDEIDKGFGELAAQNKLKPDQFKKLLRRDKINVTTLEKQIEAQLAWGKVIQREIRPRVQLTDSDIDNEVERLKLREGQEEYFLAEIFLPYGDDANASEGEVRQTANDLSRQLKNDTRKFPAAARQFSQSASAATGGIIGWVTADQMNDDIARVLPNLSVNQVSAPVKTDDGYSILFLREKRTVDLSMGKDEERMRIKLVTFELPDDVAARNIIQDDIDIFMRDVKGCLDIVAQTTKRDYATLRDFDDVKSNLPNDIVTAIGNTPIGEVREKIESDNKVQIPMLCGRDGGGSSVALEREVEGRMGMQRMDNLQKRYLRDLISGAYIERRV